MIDRKAFSTCQYIMLIKEFRTDTHINAQHKHTGDMLTPTLIV